MEIQRLILVMVFTLSLVMLWDAWDKQYNPRPAAVSKTAANTVPQLAAGTNGASPSAPMSGALPSVAQAPKAIVKTDLLTAEISAQGGDLVRLELIRHKALVDKSKNFVLFDAGAQHVYLAQSGLIGEGLANHKTLFQLAPGTYELREGSDTLQVRLEAPEADGIKVAKIYTFHRGSYLIDVGFEITNLKQTALAPHAYFQLTRDGNKPESETSMISTFTGPAVYTEAEKFQKLDFADIEKGKAKFAQKADNGWIGLVQHYFVAAWLPQGKVEREFYARKVDTNLYSAGAIVPAGSIAAGATGAVTMPLFAGPQEQDKLEALAPGMELVVDYGWLTVIAAPIFWVMEWLYRLIGNWGWAIIFLTILIKLAFFPLSAASYKSMAKMKVLAPRMQALKEQFGNDRQRMSQAVMEMYKTEKINPLGGCLPILVQIPVFIALYWVLLATVEMRGAPFMLWLQDLSTKDPYFVLPLIMGATMFIQTKLNPTPPDPIQAKVMLFMPVAFTGMFMFFPSGLVLYWVVNNLLSIAQQWQITRMIEGGKTK